MCFCVHTPCGVWVRIMLRLPHQFLEWLLKEAKDPSVIHDLLWLFNCALVEHPMQQMAAAKAKEKDDQKDQKVLTTFLTFPLLSTSLFVWFVRVRSQMKAS